MHNTNNILVGKVCHQLKEVDSTNSYAKLLLSSAKSKPFEGTAIIAHHQRAGRGQFGNVWESAAGQNLTFSVIFYPKFLAAQEQFWLNIAVSLALHELLQQLLPNKTVAIKWPNDILLNNKKVSGILIETALNGNSISHAVAGIGLNVNQTDFAPQLFKATSMAQEGGQSFDTDVVLNELFVLLEKYYLALKSETQKAALKERYLNALYGYRQTLIVEIDQQPREATILGVNRYGQLLARVDGEERVFGFKQIAFILPEGN